MSAQDLGRDLHYLGVQGDLPAIAAKLTEMGWRKSPLLAGGRVSFEPGAIEVNTVADPRVVAREVQARLVDSYAEPPRLHLGLNTEGIR